jgi:biopolymer transport protein ExbD
LPDGIELPRSWSKEALVGAPQLTISKSQVSAPFLSQRHSLDEFRAENSEVLETIKGEIREHISRLSASEKSAGLLLNIVADQDLRYDDVFRVIKVFREGGFQGLLFISNADHKRTP